MLVTLALSNLEVYDEQKSQEVHHIYSDGFSNDFASNSVDLDRDGQPDNHQ